MSFVYDHAVEAMLPAGIPGLGALGLALVMAGTSATRQRSVATLAAFSDLREYNGGYYARVTGIDVMAASSVKFYQVTGRVAGVLVYRVVGLMPVAWVDKPAEVDGADLLVEWGNDGLVRTV